MHVKALEDMRKVSLFALSALASRECSCQVKVPNFEPDEQKESEVYLTIFEGQRVHFHMYEQ